MCITLLLNIILEVVTHLYKHGMITKNYLPLLGIIGPRLQLRAVWDFRGENILDQWSRNSKQLTALHKSCLPKYFYL